jgi:hypothetical protein
VLCIPCGVLIRRSVLCACRVPLHCVPVRRGFSQTDDGQDCTPCLSETFSIGWTVGYTALIVAALLFIFAFVWRSSGAKTKRYAPRLSPPVNTPAADSPVRMCVMCSCRFTAWDEHKNWTPEDRSPPNYTHNFKILLSYLQIASTLFDLVEIPWPTAFQKFIQYFSFGTTRALT